MMHVVRYVMFVMLAISVTQQGVAAQAGNPPAPATQPEVAPEQPTGPVTVTLPEASKLPSSPGYFRLTANVNIGHRQFPIAFALFLPQAYFATTDRLPMVVALHNKGLEGSDAGAVSAEGIVSLWTRGTWDARDNVHQATPDSLDLRKPGLFIGLAPQAPRGRAMHVAPMPQVLSALMDSISAAYRVDTDRMYLTGFSYGGSQVWQIAEQLPDRFAAIVPFAARATADPAATAATLSHTPVYIGAGETDRGFTALCRQMYEALLTAGHQDVTFRVVPGGNHFSYSVMYTDPKFWEWLSSKRLSQRPATRPVDTTQAKR